MEKPVRFMGDSKDVLDGWPEEVRESVNFELEALQSGRPNRFSGFTADIEVGERPSADRKFMRDVIGKYAVQLTIKDKNSYRVIYVSKYAEAVYVLHCFQKQKDGSQTKDYRTGKSRYKDLTQYRKGEGLK